MPASSFLVGLAASMATSFAILEKVSDRRCFELRRDVNDAFIESSIYKSKLNQLIAVEKDKIEGRSEPSILDPLFKSSPNRTPGGMPSPEGSVLKAFNNASDYLDNSLDQAITLVKDTLQIGKK